MKESSKSYIIIVCEEDAIPQYNRLQLRTDPHTFIELSPGKNILRIEEYPALKYGFSQIDEPYLEPSAPYEYNGGGILEIDLSNFDATEMTTMDYMFHKLELKRLIFGEINTSNVASMVGTFKHVKVDHNLYLTDIDLSKVECASSMFSWAQIGTVYLPKLPALNMCADMFENIYIDEIVLDQVGEYDVIQVLNNIFTEGYLKILLRGVRDINQINTFNKIVDELNSHFIIPDVKFVTCYFEISTDFKFDSVDNLYGIQEDKHAESQLSNNLISQFLSETPAIRYYPTAIKPFLNPFGEITEKYTMFQGTPLDTLLGLQKVQERFPAYTPTLPLGIIISHLEQIRDTIFATNFKEDSNLELFDLHKVLKEMEVFLLTTECEGKSHTVHNLFKNGEKIERRVPTALKWCEEGGIDALGMYCPDTGSIYLWIDKIYNYRIYPLIFQSVLLHELFHLLFDVLRKGLGLAAPTSKEYEETIDNCLMLYCYSQADCILPDGAQYALKEIRSFVKAQPPVYQEGGEIFDHLQNWSDMRVKLVNYLNKTLEK